jgi:hypothetical protein
MIFEKYIKTRFFLQKTRLNVFETHKRVSNAFESAFFFPG